MLVVWVITLTSIQRHERNTVNNTNLQLKHNCNIILNWDGCYKTIIIKLLLPLPNEKDARANIHAT